jgi:hypothetical protein
MDVLVSSASSASRRSALVERRVVVHMLRCGSTVLINFADNSSFTSTSHDEDQFVSTARSADDGKSENAGIIISEFRNEHWIKPTTKNALLYTFQENKDRSPGDH